MALPLFDSSFLNSGSVLSEIYNICVSLFSRWSTGSRIDEMLIGPT